MTQPRDVIFASKLFQDWLDALKRRALLQTHNQSQAMFRAVLHALRRHMTTAQVLNFADALPPLPRGIFIEGWRPADPLPMKSVNDFVREVFEDLAPHHVPPNSIVKDVFTVLSERCYARSVPILREQIPDPLKALWPA